MTSVERSAALASEPSPAIGIITWREPLREPLRGPLRGPLREPLREPLRCGEPSHLAESGEVHER
jgi:hypothetical protein